MYDFRQPSKTSSRKTPAYPYQIKLPQKSSVPIFPYFHHFLVMKWDQGSPPIQQFALMASTIAEQQGEEKAKLAMASEEGGVCATPHLTLRKYREISSWPVRATEPAGSVRTAGQLIPKMNLVQYLPGSLLRSGRYELMHMKVEASKPNVIW